MSNVIPEAEFGERIERLNLDVPDDPVQAFLRKYDDKERVAWRRFCIDVERTVFL
jgi:hypothetical protein